MTSKEFYLFVIRHCEDWSSVTMQPSGMLRQEGMLFDLVPVVIEFGYEKPSRYIVKLGVGELIIAQGPHNTEYAWESYSDEAMLELKMRTPTS